MENLEINPNREYFLAGDVSSSMNTVDPLCGNQTRYNYMLEQFKSFIQIAQDFDEHGAPTIFLFGTDVDVYEHATLNDISSKLSRVVPNGWTNLHRLLDVAFDMHMDERAELLKDGKDHPGTVLFVFTDGEPTNKPAVERSLVNIVTQIQHEDEFQVHFLTVGTIERSLQQWLDGLHDEMENPRLNPRDFDIIHVSKLEDVTFLGAVAAKTHGELS